MAHDDNVIILGKSTGEWKRELKGTFRTGGLVATVLVVLFLVVACKPFCVVGTTEQGVVLRFGKPVRILAPGPHAKWPWPIESVWNTTTQVNRITIGFSGTEPRQTVRTQREDYRQPVSSEFLMLTGDENIIMAQLSVQYRIKDPIDYLFNVKDPEGALEDICEASLRRAIGDYGVDAPLTGGKAEIEDDIQSQAQALANRYGLGITLTSVNLQDVQAPLEVQPSFKMVVTAKENKQKYINEALGYQNGQIPRAEGKAAGVVNEASAYAQERVLRAQGDVSRFSALLTEARKAREVTTSRLYLETLETVLQKVNATIIDHRIQPLPLLDLNGGATAIRSTPADKGSEPAEPQTEGGIQR